MEPLATFTHMRAVTRLRRERVLPRPGKILVSEGQEVSPLDVIAEARLAPEYVWLNIAHGLGVSVSQANQLIQRHEGEEIGEMDVIATTPKGLFQRIVRSPCNGRVVLIGDGQVLLEKESPAQALIAAYPGKVIDVLGERGVMIEMYGALVQCVWGNGSVNHGPLCSLAKQPEEALNVEQFSHRLKGAVVLAGHCSQAEVLLRAQEIGIHGLILGSMSTRLVNQALELSYPLVLTEGFGRMPMNSAAFKLMSTNGGRDTTVIAEPYDRYLGTRPEVVIPLPVVEQVSLPVVLGAFVAGQRVRITRQPYAAKVGTITALLSSPQRLQSGLRSPAAEVILEDERRVVVPLSNLEVLE